MSFKNAEKSFGAFCELVAQLRHPVSGCPWDLKQNHETLAKYMVEEAYEAATVMKENDTAQICDELGDVLLQVVLNAQIATDDKKFGIDDVIQSIHSKMHRRHPHVFGNDEDKEKRGIDQIMNRWEEVKKQEKDSNEDHLYMEEKGVHKVFPSTTQAAKIGKAAKHIRFDWKTPDEVFDVLLSEIQELKAEWQKSHKKHSKEVYDELGDVYFTLAQLCRHLDLEPELVATDGNHKFLKRFAKMEGLAKSRGQKVSELKEEDLEALWKEVKKIPGP